MGYGKFSLSFGLHIPMRQGRWRWFLKNQLLLKRKLQGCRQDSFAPLMLEFGTDCPPEGTLNLKRASQEQLGLLCSSSFQVTCSQPMCGGCTLSPFHFIPDQTGSWCGPWARKLHELCLLRRQRGLNTYPLDSLFAARKCERNQRLGDKHSRICIKKPSCPQHESQVTKIKNSVSGIHQAFILKVAISSEWLPPGL